MESRSKRTRLSRKDIDKLKNDFFELQLRLRAGEVVSEDKYERLTDTIDTIHFHRKVEAATTQEIDDSLNVLIPDDKGSTQQRNTFLMLAARYHKANPAFRLLLRKASTAALDAALDTCNAAGQSTFLSIIKYQETPGVLCMLQQTSLARLIARLGEKIYPAEGGYALYWVASADELAAKRNSTRGMALIFTGQLPDVTAHFYLEGQRYCPDITKFPLNADDHDRLAPDANGNIVRTHRNVARIEEILNQTVQLTGRPDHRETLFMALLKYHGAVALHAVMRRSILLAQNLFSLMDIRSRNIAASDDYDPELIPMAGPPKAADQQRFRMMIDMDFLANPVENMKKSPADFVTLLTTILPTTPADINDHAAWRVILQNAIPHAPRHSELKNTLLALAYRVNASQIDQGNEALLKNTCNDALKITDLAPLCVEDNLLIATTLESYAARLAPSEDKESPYSLKALQHLYYAAKKGNASASERLFGNEAANMKKLTALLAEKWQRIKAQPAGVCHGLLSHHREELQACADEALEYCDFRHQKTHRLHAR